MPALLLDTAGAEQAAENGEAETNFRAKVVQGLKSLRENSCHRHKIGLETARG